MKIIRFLPTGCTRGRIAAFGVAVCVIIILHFVIVNEQDVQVDDFPNLDVQTMYMASLRPLTPLEEFPTRGDNFIPKIIHQTWKDVNIPANLGKWLKSWTANHPDWLYMFWTDESARDLIADKYPEYLFMFDQYTEGIRKADALRYFVLYEYGGVYADLDIESLKSIEPMTLKYHCFIGQEPYEHPVLDSNFENLAINALMGCGKRHPFMKFVIENLPNFSHMWNVLDSTGPHFLTLLYRSYIKSVANSKHRNGVYLSPPDYFFPTLDPVKIPYFKTKCKAYDKLPRLQQKACVSLKANGLHRKPLSYSFAVHHWMHTYLQHPVNVFQMKKTIKISDIVPNVKLYNQK